MKLPLMTKVFNVQEANVTTMAQMNKIDVKTAEELNKFDRKNAAIHAKMYRIFVNAVYDNFSEESKSKPIEYDEYAMEGYLHSVGKKLKIILNKQPGKANEFLGMAAKNFQQFQKALDDTVNPLDIGKLKAKAVMKFPDGFFWVEISGDECRREGDEMQHCGIAQGDMYSLRDENGKPHVTVDILKKGTPQWKKQISGDQGYGAEEEAETKDIAIQIKGKQNHIPDKKYWPYIRKFFGKERIIHSDMSHYDDDANAADEFNMYLDS